MVKASQGADHRISSEHRKDIVPADASVDDSFLVAFVASGMVYILLCAPLVWLYATQAGKSFPQMLLLLDLPRSVEEAFEHSRLPPHSQPDEVAFWFSLGVAYGVLCLISAVMHSGRLPIIEVAVAGFSFFYGYLLTIAIVAGPHYVFQVRVLGLTQHTAKIIYIYFIYLVLESMKAVLASRLWRPEPIRFLFDGLFGIFVAVFISYGHEHQLPEIFVGPLFIINSFLCILFCERYVLRVKCAMFLTMHRLEPFMSRWKIGRTTKEWVKKCLAAMLAQFWKELRQPHHNLIHRTEHLMRLYAPPSNPRAPTWSIYLGPFFAIVALMTLWPAVMVGINYLVLNWSELVRLPSGSH